MDLFAPPPGVTLDSILCTDELRRRPAHAPDYEAESRALLRLSRHLTDSPDTILQELTDVALEVFAAGSAGVSLISDETGDFYWPAISGAWKPRVGGGTPRPFGPCGTVLDHDAAQVFRRPERYFPYMAAAVPLVQEAILQPFYLGGQAVGTVWVISHDEARKFDYEDIRLLGDLSTFAAAAYLYIQNVTNRVQAETSLRTSEERYRFLDGVSEAMRTAEDSGTVMSAAMRLLGEHLGVARCAYADVDADNDRFTMRDDWRVPGVATTAGIYSLDLFGTRAATDLRANRVLVVRDVDAELTLGDGGDTFTAIGIKAIICCPLVKEGRLRAMMAVHNAVPRDWREDEISLVREVAERSWAHIERVASSTALLKSENRLQRAISIETVGVLFFNLDGRIHDANAALARMSGYAVEELSEIADWGVLTPPEFSEVTRLAAEEIALTGVATPYEKQWIRKDGSRFWGLFSPTRLSGEGFNSECVEFVIDITARKRAEEELLDAHAELERRVHERTRELAQTNEALSAEIVERKALENVRDELIRKIVSTQEEERRRMARDLHDELGQQLTALRFKLDLLGQSDRPSDELFEELRAMAQRIDAGVDRIAWDLRPAVLDDLGLFAALDRFMQEWSRHTGICVELLESNLEGLRLPPEAETNLYRIAQEALNNAHKHANASRVEVVFRARSGKVVLIVEDDGQGFDAEDLSNRSSGLGLTGMQERIRLIGGEIDIESAPGKGT
ncbi:MAG: GAF domain-containing protein, partial [Pyrinomonadaceae bacterium]